MKEQTEDRRNTRASRGQVFAAADQALKAGRRPTQEGVRNALGGGSLTSINTYLNEWYADLGARLSRAEKPVGGVPPEANELLQQLWWLALKGRTAGASAGGETEEVRMMRSQKDAAMAQSSALQTLNGELTRARANAERALADTRALLLRREAALEEERAARLQLEQELANLRLQVEVASARRDLLQSRGREVAAPKAKRGPPRKARPKGKKGGRRRARKSATSKRVKSTGRLGSGTGRVPKRPAKARRNTAKLAGKRKSSSRTAGRRR